jgi:hypothetical protein
MDYQMNELRAIVADEGVIPFSWAGSTMEMNYLNYGDALSPVMVSLVTGLSVRRVPTRSKNVRLAAVGTIAHGFDLGTTYFWGTGSSPWRNPSAPLPERQPFVRTENSVFNVCATRGPLSRDLLGGGAVPFCDPVWLLPRFYNPQVEKKYELGIILHLSELESRELNAGPKLDIKRSQIPASLQGKIKTINTLTAISSQALGEKTAEILECKRIVSTSLHGLVIAESYGIPCLYFPNFGDKTGLVVESLKESFVDLRMQDLYTGIGLTSLPMYLQPKSEETDWDALIAAIDKSWEPKTSQEDALIEAMPLPTSLLAAREGETIWDHPVIQGLPYQLDVVQVRREDALRAKSQK